MHGLNDAAASVTPCSTEVTIFYREANPENLNIVYVITCIDMFDATSVSTITHNKTTNTHATIIARDSTLARCWCLQLFLALNRVALASVSPHRWGDATQYYRLNPAR